MKGYLKLLDFFGLKSGVVFYDKLADLLIEHEGIAPLPYLDSEGVLTCGIGRNLTEPLSETAMGFLLLESITGAEAALDSVLPKWREFDEARKLALLDMAYNLGQHRLSKFKRMISCINDGDWDGAAREALDSKWRRQVGRRAVKIARMLRDGDSLQAD